MKRRKRLVIPIACMLTVLLLFRGVFLIGYVPSASMEPTLQKGSIIIGIRLHGDLQTGDIIIFRREGELLVKRIAASPGESIRHNGEQITVPDDCYYVRGDNADDSFDSRYWDDPFVKGEDVVAKLL